MSMPEEERYFEYDPLEEFAWDFDNGYALDPGDDEDDDEDDE